MMKTGLLKKIICGATAAFLTLAASYAAYNSYGIPDSSEIRTKLVDTWFEAPLGMVRSSESKIFSNDIGQKFQVRCEEDDSSLKIIVSPASQIEVEAIKNDVRETRMEEVFFSASAGSWVLYRNRSTGKAERVLWYFNEDSSVYLQFTAESTKTFADVLVYGNYLVKHTPVGIPFERLYTASFQEIQNWTKKSVPWNKVTVVPGQYRGLLQTAFTIRNFLSKMEFLKDACYDEKGRLCSVLTEEEYFLLDEDKKPYSPQKPGVLMLSSSGFIKWIADGLIYPYTGKYTTISSLAETTVEYDPLGKTGAMNRKYDIAFSLNWTRNLALALWNAQHSRQVSYKESGVDVEYNHFTKVPAYSKNTGYKVELLKSLLYVQAVIEPGYAYLGAIKEYSVTKPEEFVFNNAAVFFPYFDDKGRFDCIVFDSGKEMTLDAFISDYKNAFVNLSRIKTSEDFYPQEMTK